jgi:2'-5' RNA ligase
MPEADVQDAASATSASALVVPFSVPPALARVRERWDHAALTGAGPHVTILYPFVPCVELGLPARAQLAAIARAVPAFEVRFEQVRRLPDVVWVEPKPNEPFAAMTAAVAGRWPEFPPYGGAFETDIIPHLTIVESDMAALDEIEGIARRVTPFARRAQRLELWCQDGAGRWRTRWRMPFAARP